MLCILSKFSSPFGFILCQSRINKLSLRLLSLSLKHPGNGRARNKQTPSTNIQTVIRIHTFDLSFAALCVLASQVPCTTYTIFGDKAPKIKINNEKFHKFQLRLKLEESVAVLIYIFLLLSRSMSLKMFNCCKAIFHFSE